LDGLWLAELTISGSCFGLVLVIMVAICLSNAAGYDAADAVEALPFVEELTRGGCLPHFVDVLPFHWVYVHDLGV
jgi:hypothetical protein